MSIIYMVVWLVIGPLWWKLLGQSDTRERMAENRQSSGI
jgi:hypothetical protein